jgi:hypothetical protein
MVDRNKIIFMVSFRRFPFPSFFYAVLIPRASLRQSKNRLKASTHSAISKEEKPLSERTEQKVSPVATFPWAISIRSSSARKGENRFERNSFNL